MSQEPAYLPPRPTYEHMEKLRLILSTYQDGTGMIAAPGGMTLPGWRDFERAVAAVFGGVAQESKYVFDVVVPDAEYPGLKYGISCKMRRELDRVLRRDGRVTMELSNSANMFWRYLLRQGIDEANYREKPGEVGAALIELVSSWHEVESITGRGTIYLNRSFYLVLSWSQKGQYQVHQFALSLPDPQQLHWFFPTKTTRQGEQPADRLCGADEAGVVFEWYGKSGGQLKYYPRAETALWASGIFQLEPLPDSEEMNYGVLAKARTYFPAQWKKTEF